MATKRVRQAVHFLSSLRLEDRCTPSSTLYLDFGDNFPNGGFDLTVGSLRQTFADGGLQGPNLSGTNYADDTAIRFRPTADLVNFDYNVSGGVDGADWTDLRAAVVGLVQRYYAPFDVDVVIAPPLDNSSSGAYFAGVLAVLQSGPDVTGERDTWAFVADAIRTDSAASIGSELSIYGIAASADISGINARDDSCLICSDRVLSSFTGSPADTALAYTSAHESAHTFGLAHTSDLGSTNALLSCSDLIVGSAGNTNRTNFDFITRYPLILDGFSSSTVNNYDRLANPNRLGLRPGAPAYITGTGAHDIITVTQQSATQANVSVRAFNNSTYTNSITVPGTSRSTAYSYTVPLDPAAGLLIDCGFNNDRVVLDATIGVPVAIRGMGGTDQLIVNGNGALFGSYVPGAASPAGLDGNTSRSGTITVGSTTIAFDEFDAASTVEINGVDALTVVTPASQDVLTLDVTPNGRFQVNGSSGGVGLVTLQADVTSLTLDAGTNDAADPSDTVTVNLGSLSSSAARRCVIATGAGDDVVAVSALASYAELIIDTGDGDDAISIDSNGPIAGGTVDAVLGPIAVNGGDGDNSLMLDDSSDATGDGLSIDAARIGSLGDTFFGPGGTLSYQQITAISLHLGSESDSVTLTPSETTEFTIDDSGPVPAGDDRLTLMLDGAANPVRASTSGDSGQWTFENRRAVNYVNVENQFVDSTVDVTIGDGDIQRSRIDRLQVVFDSIVGFMGVPESAFRLERISGGEPAGSIAIAVNANAIGGQTVVSIAPQSDTTFGSLDDGRYRLTVLGSQVTISGVTLAHDTVSEFHRLFGDSNGDARIDIADFGAFSTTYNRLESEAGFAISFDYNADGRIDIGDFGQLSVRLFTSLP